MLKVVVFDFDDTLTWKTERKKQEAFWKIFSEFSDAEPIAREFVIEHPGLPRRAMIEKVLELFEKRKIRLNAKFNIDYFLNEYTRVTEKMAIEAKPMPGAEEALKFLLGKYHLYINSATPQSSLERIINGRGWNKYFKGIYGLPPGSKLEHMQEIISREDVSSNQVVVVGDGVSDIEAAKEYGSFFIGIQSEYYDFDSAAFPVLEDLSELPSTIANLG